MLSKSQYKYFAKLLQKKYRYQQRKFMVEGVRLCRELIQSSLTITALIYTDKLKKHPLGLSILENAQSRNIPRFETTDDNLARLTQTCTPQCVVACANISECPINAGFFSERRFLVLMDISDPGNVGTLLRTAEAFGWNRILSVGQTVDIYNTKVIRASMGSMFRLKIVQSDCQRILSYFEDMNVGYVVSMPRQGIIPPLISYPPKLALFLGNEAYGLPDSLISKAYAIVQIPMAEQVDSLNVSVAGAILLFLLQ